MELKIVQLDLASVISAICALATLIMSFVIQHRNEKEKNELVKSNFFILTCNMSNSKFDTSIKNIGNQNIRNISIRWRDNRQKNDIDISIVDKTENTNFEYEIIIDLSKVKDEEDINGSIVITYVNSYGKKQECYYEITLYPQKNDYEVDKSNKFFIHKES